MSYFDRSGLLGPSHDFYYSYNSLLYTVEYILLQQILDPQFNPNNFVTDNPECLITDMKSVLKSMEITPGLFRNYPSEDPASLMSHDNMTALACMSVLLGESYHERLWAQMRSQGYGMVQKYNNLADSSETRFVHPRDTLFLGMLSGNLICWFFFPVYALMLLLQIPSSDTSGKLLSFISLQTMKGNIFFKILFSLYTFLLRFTTFQNWEAIFLTYFVESEHVNNILARQVWKSN